MTKKDLMDLIERKASSLALDDEEDRETLVGILWSKFEREFEKGYELGYKKCIEDHKIWSK